MVEESGAGVFPNGRGKLPRITQACGNFAEIAACESPRNDFQRGGDPITFGGAREAVSGGRSGLAC